MVESAREEVVEVMLDTVTLLPALSPDTLRSLVNTEGRQRSKPGPKLLLSPAARTLKTLQTLHCIARLQMPAPMFSSIICCRMSLLLDLSLVCISRLKA